MTPTVGQHPARVRCYQCGSSTISALCHHCWRPGCGDHVTATPSWADRLLGPEASGPGLEQERAYHCAACAHAPADRQVALAVAGVALVFAGLLTALVNVIACVILAVIGILSTGAAYTGARRRDARARAGLSLPLRPKVTGAGLEETLRCRITLGKDGSYTTDLDPVEGELSAVLTFGAPDQERLGRYRRSHPGAASTDVPFIAGCLVLQGPAGIGREPGFPAPILPQEGRTGAFPVFRTQDPHASSTWPVKLPYQLSPKPEISSGPVWVTPSVVPGSDRRALEVDIQWVDLGPEDRRLTLDVVDLVELNVPADWGLVEGASRRLITGTAPGNRRSLQWRQFRPDQQELAAQRLTLAIRFDRQIDMDKELDELIEISGRLELTMKGTLSGASGVKLYSALGRRRDGGTPARVRTRVEAEFRLSLASIRYEDVLLVPREAEDGEEAVRTSEFAAIPDDETVIALTNALSERGYYVKRVIENPPRSGGRASHVQRYWDIAGRRYEGVYPIDFHMVLTGEEVHSGDIRPESGTTRIRITVRGTYTDDKMARLIEQEWDTLQLLTSNALRCQKSASPPQTEQAPDARESVGDSSATLGRRFHLTDPPAADPRLRQRLSKLDDALLDKRITQEQYQEMRGRAEQEFGGS